MNLMPPETDIQSPTSNYSVEAWLSKGLTFVRDVSHGKMIIADSSVNMVGDNGQTLVSFPISTLKKVKQYDRSFAFNSSSGKYFISIMDPSHFVTTSCLVRAILHSGLLERSCNRQYPCQKLEML